MVKQLMFAPQMDPSDRIPMPGLCRDFGRDWEGNEKDGGVERLDADTIPIGVAGRPPWRFSPESVKTMKSLFSSKLKAAPPPRRWRFDAQPIG
jgi:hypothetical protein